MGCENPVVEGGKSNYEGVMRTESSKVGGVRWVIGPILVDEFCVALQMCRLRGCSSAAV